MQGLVKHHDFSIKVVSKLDIHLIETDSSVDIHIYDHSTHVGTIKGPKTLDEARQVARDFIEENYEMPH